MTSVASLPNQSYSLILSRKPSLLKTAPVAHEDSDLRLMLDRFTESTKLFGLTISPEKTEALHQPAPGGNNAEPVITIDSTHVVSPNKTVLWTEKLMFKSAKQAKPQGDFAYECLTNTTFACQLTRTCTMRLSPFTRL